MAEAPRGTASLPGARPQGQECHQKGVAQPDLASLPTETRCSGEQGYVGSGHASWNFRREPTDGVSCCAQCANCFSQWAVESSQVAAGFPPLCTSQLLSW